MEYGSEVAKVCEQAAERACDLAFQYASDDLTGLKGGRMCFYPVVNYEDDTFGVGVNPDYHYLVYQNNGFASFAMKSCIGKTIPMMTPNGLIFRKCTGVGQWRSGTRDYWSRDINGNLMVETKQRRAWTHPGLGPKRFIDDAVDDAMSEYEDDIIEAVFYDGYGMVEEELDRTWPTR